MANKPNRRLPGADPYLVWAELSKFAGYDRGGDSNTYQVVVETKSGAAPWKSDPAIDPKSTPFNKYLDQRLICKIGHNYVWSGTVDEENFRKLRKDRTLKLELNVPQNHAAFGGGSGVLSAPVFDDLKNYVIAVIDHGCPFAHKQFLIRNDSNWESRVRYLWDQGRPPKRNEGWFPVKFDRVPSYGREMSTGSVRKPGWSMTKQIRDATDTFGQVDEDLLYRNVNYDAMDIRKTHGAHVLDLAAGAINPLTGEKDAASDADIIFVQLPRSTVADTSGGSMTKYVLDALKYIFARAPKAEHLVINLSYGSTAGPHDGSSILEKAIDTLIVNERKKRKHLEIVLPAGNHFLAQGHTEVTLSTTELKKSIHWHVMPDNQTDSFLELWYEPVVGASVEIHIDCPDGTKVGPVALGSTQAIRSQAKALSGAVIHSDNTPNGKNAMVLIAVGPTHAEPTGERSPAPHGFWKITVGMASEPPNAATEVVVQAWVERDDPLPGQVGQPQSYLLANRLDRTENSDDLPTDTVRRRTSGNSLANGNEPIVVGACVNIDANSSQYSAAGPTLNAARYRQRSWPDCSAVGDESYSVGGIQAAGTRSGVLVRMNGSSVAAPQIARKLLNAWLKGVPTPFPLPPTANTGSPMDKQRAGEFAQTYPHLHWER